MPVKSEIDINSTILDFNERIYKINELINKHDAINKKHIKKINEALLKLSSKKDIGVLQEDIKNKMLDIQSNHTKKIKTVRDNINSVKKNIEENKKESDNRLNTIKNAISSGNDEQDLNSQLALLGISTGDK